MGTLNRPLLRFLLLGLVSFPTASGSGQEFWGATLPVREHTLENGLNLFVLPRQGASTVSFVTQYRVGSVHEEAGATGLAHLREHLFFKRTATVGTESYESEIGLLQEMDVLYGSLLLESGRRNPDCARIQTLDQRIGDLEEEASQFVASNQFDAILSENGARNLNSNFGLALQIAASASLFGDWRTTFSFSDRIQAVTPEDIQRVVSEYLRREKRTIAVLVRPEASEGKHSPGAGR